MELVNVIDYPADTLVSVYCARCPLDSAIWSALQPDVLDSVASHVRGVHPSFEAQQWAEGDDWWCLTEADAASLNAVRVE